MVVNAVYYALLLGNLVVIAASLTLGPHLLWVCRAAVFVTGIARIQGADAFLDIPAPPQEIAHAVAKCLVLDTKKIVPP